MLTEAIEHVLGRRDLGRERISTLFEEVFAGRATDAQIAGLLVALRMKGETVDEVTGAAEALRRRARHVTTPEGRMVMDTCGTGGDKAGTFNVSTAVAFVAAAAGIVVAKHGNARVSSRCGSADVLRAAGVALEVSPSCVEQCLADVGVAFLLAPQFHPVMKVVSGVRRELGVRSIFNILGPLANPARAGRQLLGVYDGALVPIVAGALLALGTERSLVVHGDDGLDEVSPCGPTRAILVEKGRLVPLVITPEDAGLRRLGEPGRGALSGGDPSENARLLREVLAGRGPLALVDTVVLNSAAALWVAEVGQDLRECAEIARSLLTAGSAGAKLDALARLTTESASRTEKVAS
jgi:anthranilate phosphoribosyltransferase